MAKVDIRPTLPLILSILLGFGAVVMVRNYISGERRALTEGMEEVKVVVANRNIPANYPITGNDLAAKGIPRKFVHANSIYPEDVELIVNRELLYPVAIGDPILWMDFKGGEGYRGFSSMIKEGERAVTLKMDKTSTLAGLLQPGDHVDIMGTFTPRRVGKHLRDPETTLALLQNVVILAAGQQTSARSRAGRDQNASMLTVLVTPEEAALLIHAQKVGNLYNVLRNPNDIDTLPNLPKVTFTDILQPTYRKTIQEARDKIIIYKGTDVSHELQ